MSTFKEALQDYIINAQNIDQIIPILKHMSLESIKDFTSNQINNMATIKARHITMHYQSIQYFVKIYHNIFLVSQLHMMTLQNM